MVEEIIADGLEAHLAEPAKTQAAPGTQEAGQDRPVRPVAGRIGGDNR